jgi:hypothetical protein
VIETLCELGTDRLAVFETEFEPVPELDDDTVPTTEEDSVELSE